MDIALAKKYFPVFLAAGVTCCLLILAYTERPYTPMEDKLALHNQCIIMADDMTYHNICTFRCEKVLDREDAIKPNYNLPSNFSESTCSLEATSRGSNQRVISFSFYGNISSSRSYFQGIQRNAQLIRQFYPGYVMRVYHNVSDPEVRHLLCQIQCSNTDVLDICFVGHLPGYGNLTGSQPNAWRFLAISDPLVDLVLSRDLDSKLNGREVAAVHEWLGSNASMHVMRDNRYHDVPMLAGMWGVRLNNNDRHEWRAMIERLLLRAKVAGKHYLDQVLLKEEVWNDSRRPGWVLQHDSYYCKKYNTTGKMLAFPTQRLIEPMNFVGSRIFVDTKPTKVECPPACRRNPKWKFC